MLHQSFSTITFDGEFDDFIVVIDPVKLSLQISPESNELSESAQAFALEISGQCESVEDLEARYQKFADWLEERTQQFIGGAGHDNETSEDLAADLAAAANDEAKHTELAERAAALTPKPSKWPAMAKHLRTLFADHDLANDEAIRDFFSDYLYGELGEEALADAIEYVIAFDEIDSTNEPGCKFGGFPNLPSNLTWPKGNFAFLAQFDFAVLNPCDVYGQLPAAGVCFVFIDTKGEPFTVLSAEAFGPDAVAPPSGGAPLYSETFWRPHPSFYIAGSSDTRATHAFTSAVSEEVLASIKTILGMAESDEACAMDSDRIFGEVMDWQSMDLDVGGVFFTHIDANGFSVNIGVHPHGLRLNDFSVMSYAGSGT